MDETSEEHIEKQTEERWYYIDDDDEKKGPYDQEYMLDLLDEKEIGEDTLVWTSPMKDWKPIAEIDNFENPPPIVEECSQVRPWIRYWARTMDILIISFILGFFLSIFIPVVLETAPIIASVIILFAYTFIEAWLLSTWGTTPGKWLLKVQVRDHNGEILTYKKALKRSLLVWSIGIAGGLPLVSLITYITHFFLLKNRGITFWDNNQGCIVRHEPIDRLRITATVLIILLFVLLITYTNTSTSHSRHHISQTENTNMY